MLVFCTGVLAFAAAAARNPVGGGEADYAGKGSIGSMLRHYCSFAVLGDDFYSGDLRLNIAKPCYHTQPSYHANPAQSGSVVNQP
jgi:hypothetical protein